MLFRNTLAEENYLKAIFYLSQGEDGGVSTNALAQRMETKASSATDMVKRLAEKELVNHAPYQGVTLTPKGKEVAVRTIRKHRLWEVFLVEKLRFGWEEVHDLAEQLEHIQSTELTDRLDEFLDFPRFDPHGDPIPDRNGNFPSSERYSLISCELGSRLTVTGVRDTAPEFLQFLDRYGIGLGSRLEVVAHHAFDRSVEVKLSNGQLLVMSRTAAENLFVKPLS